MRFETGQTVVRRCVHNDGRIAAVESARVISDDDQGLLLWVAGGSTVVRRTTSDGAPVRKMPLLEKMSIPTYLTPSAWHGHGVLILTPPDVAHSLWWFFSEDRTFHGWYVNLEAPRGRWSGGYDMQDQALDLWVWPDGSWEWKDEDELAERTGHPLFWDADAVPGIRAEGERMIELARQRAFPFDGTYVDFTPDPSWTPSTLIAEWDRPRCP